jgi:hypothetical protein
MYLHIFCTYKIALSKTISTFTGSTYTKVQTGRNAKVLYSQAINRYLIGNQSGKPERCEVNQTAPQYEYLAFCVISGGKSRAKDANVPEFNNYHS